MLTHNGLKAPEDHPPFGYPDFESTVEFSPEKAMVRLFHTLPETSGPGSAGADVSNGETGFFDF